MFSLFRNSEKVAVIQWGILLAMFGGGNGLFWLQLKYHHQPVTHLFPKHRKY